MCSKLIKVLFIACLSLIFAVSSTFAQGKGRGHNKNRPPGWEEGEKKDGNPMFLWGYKKKMKSRRKKEINQKIGRQQSPSLKLSKRSRRMKQKLKQKR